MLRAILKFLSQKFASGKRRDDLALLKYLVIANESKRGASVALRTKQATQVSCARTLSVVNMLSGEFSKGGVALVERDGDVVRLSDAFGRALADADFKRHVLDTSEFGLSRNALIYAEPYKDTDFVLNAKYTREEICRLLHWDKEPNMQNVGGYFHDKATNTFPVFINYEKDPSTISITTMYEDRFVSDRELIAISKSNRTMHSPEINNLRNAAKNDMRCFLFVRKNKEDKDDGTEFYFLGEMHPTGQFHEITMHGTTTSAVEIWYRLETPVKADLYDYFLSDLDVDA